MSRYYYDKLPCWLSLRPDLDENYAREKAAPPQENRGLFRGYRFPIWEAINNPYDELLFRIRVPFRWDGVTNPYFCAISAIGGNEMIGAMYKFQLEWVSKDVGNILPDTIDDTVTSEIIIVDPHAWRAEILVFELDATKIISGENMQGRLRRIDASHNEVVYPPVVFHWCTRWKMDKLGTFSAQGYGG